MSFHSPSGSGLGRTVIVMVAWPTGQPPSPVMGEALYLSR